MSDLISRSELIKFFKEHIRTAKDFREIIINIIPTIENQPTAYDVDKVVEELEKTMQDLNVIEVLSHIDFDSTIQNGLDNFLKAYNSELLRIVKQGSASDDVCEWRLCDEEANVYDTSCRNTHILIESTPKENNYEYCPYCGKKIKVVE